MSHTQQTPPKRSAASTQIPPNSTRTVTSAPRTSPPVTGRQNGETSPRKRAVKEVIGVLTLPLASIATVQQIREPDSISPFTMDIYAIDNSADALANGIVKFADNYPVVGALLDKIGNIAPVGELFAVGMGLLMQIAENHKQLPEGIAKSIPGVIPRQELAQQIAEDSGLVSQVQES